MKRKTIPAPQTDLFAYQNWIEKLAESPTALDRLNQLINFEDFRETLEADLPEVDPEQGGRPPFDAVLMFKILLLQRLHGQLSDEQTAFQIRDRFSFQRFLGLSLESHMPCTSTIWNYREIWSQKGTIDRCFSRYQDVLTDNGLREDPGKIVDASFVEVPKQRNTPEENEHIKEHGTAPEGWEGHPPKLAQKDIDARWTKKNKETYYGYKLHAIVDSLSKIISGYTVTTASTHDSNVFLELLDPERDESVHADSAYASWATENTLAKIGIGAFIAEKGKRNQPLSPQQKEGNTVISSIRSRVEHVFGDMTNSMKAMSIRCIGMTRAAGIIGLNALAYNMRRFEQIVRLKLIDIG